jgi:hypothetical protein
MLANSPPLARVQTCSAEGGHPLACSEAVNVFILQGARPIRLSFLKCISDHKGAAAAYNNAADVGWVELHVFTYCRNNFA